VPKRSRRDQAGRRNVKRSCQCGAVAFKRAGDPNVGEFSDAVVLKKFGDVPEDLSALSPWSYCCVMTGTAAAGFAVSSPDPARLVNFLDYAGLTMCCRNAAIR
jgi:hypothetical protein